MTTDSNSRFSNDPIAREPASSEIVYHQPLDDQSPMPLYHQIKVILREKIITGVYANGDVLPSENELQDMFGVSRITAKRALDDLASVGLAKRQRGKGTIVTFDMPLSAPNTDMHGLMENLLATSGETTAKVLSFGYEPAPPAAADAMKIAPNTLVQRVVRVRSTEHNPFSYVVTYVPEKIGRSFDASDLENHPMIYLIEKAGVTIMRATQTVTATLADSQIAPILTLQVGAPLLKVTRVVYDQHDKVVEYIHVYYRPDLYQLTYDLSRQAGQGGNHWSADTG